MELNKTQYMSELKYKVGDKVRINGFGWYNENKDETDDIECSNNIWFYREMSKFCGKVMTISHVRVDHYTMVEDLVNYWTDDMIEGLVERNGKTYPYKIGDRVILKGNNRCATITDLKYNSFGNLSYYIKIDNDKDISIDYPTELLLPYDNVIECKAEEESKPNFKIGDKVIVSDTSGIWEITDMKDDTLYSLKRENHTATLTTYGGFLTLHESTTDEMIDGLVEEETPKFKIDDIVFVKNLGWVRITNSYWDSLANEYIYEAIGFNGEGEYDSINQSNIECQMLPESENPHTCGNKITLDEYKNNDKEWLFNKLAMLDNITALESIQDIFNHLQQPKYPKTYKECLSVLGVPDVVIHNAKPSEYKLFESLIRLKRCRDAYWKIYGEENGLGKPWELDWREGRYIIYRNQDDIIRGYREAGCAEHHILSFPTAEMRDYFKENFGTDIEICKEFL